MASEVDQLFSRAESLVDRFKQGGQRYLIDEAINLARQALDLCLPWHADRPTSLLKLSGYLSTRYGRFGSLGDLEEAITLGFSALFHYPWDPSLADCLNSLVIHLVTRYNRLGILDDLDRAIELGRVILMVCPPGHPGRPDCLNNLGVNISTRYDQLGVLDDLDEAITLAYNACLCPPDHPHLSIFLNGLGNHVFTRYKQLGTLDDLEEAIRLGRAVLLLRPQGHPGRSGSSSNLSGYLGTRFRQLGTTDDLEEAITLSRDALVFCPLGHPSRPGYLSNLGHHLYTRYNRLGILRDLNEAITISHEALRLRPQGDPDRPISLNNLSLHLIARYNLLDELDDLEEAIAFGREALMLRPPGNPGRGAVLCNLGINLVARYGRLSIPDDLEEAIVLGREMLLFYPLGHPERSSSLRNLSGFLSMRYEKFWRPDDLEEAITLGREAHLLCPQGHPGLPHALYCLSKAIFYRFARLQSEADKRESFNLFIQLADVEQITSSDDLSVVRIWITAAEDFQHPSTILAYQTALRFIVHHLSALPTLPQHLVNVKTLTSSLAVDAFSACVRNHAPTHAVALLEQGRGVFWGQLARLHSPLEDVIASGSAGSALADEFTRLTSVIRNAISSPDPNQHDQLCSLNTRLQAVVSEIRQLPHLSRFLLPPAFSDLQQAARGGPVIIVNASIYSCDALIVLLDRDPIHVPLPKVTKKDIQDMSSRLGALMKRAESVNVSRDLRHFLRELWVQVVSPIVDILRTVCSLQSRIWWCPTAEFTLLPLHAAGPYRMKQRKLSNLYISSYTPTLSALIRARRRVEPELGAQECHERLVHSHRSSFVREIPRQEKHFVAIGQATVSGQENLVSVGRELAEIGQLVNSVTMFTPIEGPESHMSRVIEELGKNEWVHFACHGIPDEKKPFESAFALHDGHLTIGRITQCELKDPEFAYLSACHTTVGDEESPDEVIHLAAAMQFVGFRSVIGTMWAVDDRCATKVASTFYKRLLGESGRLDYTRAALALKETMKELKWRVPIDQRIVYIHIGA